MTTRHVDNLATADSDQTPEVTDVWTVPFASMTIVKTVTSTGPYKLNDVATFSITVTNTGLATLHSVVITEAGVNAVLAASCEAGPTTQGITLEPGESVICSATHIVTQADFDTGTYTNIARATSDETDPVADDETIPTPDPAVDLAIVKTASTAVLTVGTEATYSLVVSNNGPAEATSTSVTDVIPSDLSVISANGPGWTCNVVSQTVTCTTETTLAVGASLPVIGVVVSVTGLAGGSIANTATVATTQVDRDPTNNTSTVTVPTAQVLGTSIVRSTTTTTAPAAILAKTGQNVDSMSWFAVVLIGVGLVLVGVRRRRRSR